MALYDTGSVRTLRGEGSEVETNSEKERLENEERLRLEEQARQVEARRAEEEEELRRAKLEKERLELEEREKQKRSLAEKDALLKAEDDGNTEDDVVELGLGQATKKTAEKKEMSEFEKMKLMMLSAADEYQELRNEYETEFGEQWSPAHKSLKTSRWGYRRTIVTTEEGVYV